MYSLLFVPLSFLSLASASPLTKRAPGATWTVSQFNSLITFGDSYTDENRLSYFISHNYTAPPPGTLLGESFNTATGGRDWSRYVVQYTGTNSANGTFDPQITLYNYAVSGAVCSNDITPRSLAPGVDFPAVQQYEIPAFIADSTSIRNGTASTPYFTPALTPTDAVYAIWIGTNDLGNNAFITDSQAPGTTLTDYTDCVFSAFDRLYAFGGRYFVLFNNAPLNLVPQYANASNQGVTASKFWTDKPDNVTAVSERMQEEVATTNQIFKYQVPVEVRVSGRYPDANFAIYNVHDLLTDIYLHPTQYLNGTGAPLNVTGFDNHCDAVTGACTRGDSPDSFLWFDELHPSEQADRIIAREFVGVLGGDSTWAAYW